MQKDITIYDIARALNISATTVSRALQNNAVINDNTRDAIQKKAKELGYRHNTLASNLRKQQSKTIGLLLHELNSNFVTSVLAGIEKVASEEGYDLLITHSAENGMREIANAKNLLNKRVDGLIVSLALTSSDTSHFTPFFDRKVPIVFFDRVPDFDCTKIIIDNFKSGYDATMHLINNGYKKIAHITADLARNVYNDRFQGYKQALADNNIRFSKNLLHICNLDKIETVAAVNALLKYGPDAFFITNDFAAAVCMEELRTKGISVPNDIGVFGFNNDVLCDLVSPKLSTVDYRGIKMGEAAAKELLKQLRQKDKASIPKTIIIPSKTIVRKSSVPYKRSTQNSGNNKLG